MQDSSAHNDSVIGDTLRHSFELPAAHIASDPRALMEQLIATVAEWLQDRPDFLLSLLYRLDVDETPIKIALSGPDPATAIAGLIVTRQKKRLQTRSHFSNSAGTMNSSDW